MTSLALTSALTFILMILAMAFFTLLERKVLGYSQMRKGPNKVNMTGIPQPLADAMKLFLKERASPLQVNKYPYLIAPMFSLMMALAIWALYSSSAPTIFIQFGGLFFLAVSSVSVYGTLVSGWASNSKYALLGALRAIAQTISYEVSMALIFLAPLTMMLSYNMNKMHYMQSPLPLTIMLLPVAVMWFITTLAETNRAPFDFAEGESELVSGFNVEYSGVTFAFIFMAEYITILMMSFMTTSLFLGGPVVICFAYNPLMWLKTSVVAFLFLWTRSTLPRLRYDLLMDTTWKIFLPVILLVMMYLFSTHPFLFA